MPKIENMIAPLAVIICLRLWTIEILEKKKGKFREILEMGGGLISDLSLTIRGGKLFVKSHSDKKNLPLPALDLTKNAVLNIPVFCMFFLC